jgi:hypothetical protein
VSEQRLGVFHRHQVTGAVQLGVSDVVRDLGHGREGELPGEAGLDRGVATDELWVTCGEPEGADSPDVLAIGYEQIRPVHDFAIRAIDAGADTAAELERLEERSQTSGLALS